MIRVETHRTVLAALARAVSERRCPEDPVTLALPWVADRRGLAVLRTGAAVGSRQGLAVRLDVWPGGWRRHGVLVLTGRHRSVGHWYLLWRKVTGIP